MSSFQNFKRSVNKSHKSNSRISVASQEVKPKLDNFFFSTREILFEYNDSQSVLINSQLTITNRTGVKIYFKIRSSQAQFYDVYPHQEIVDCDMSVRITIKLKKDRIIKKNKQNFVSSFAKVYAMTKSNVFEVVWGQITQANLAHKEIPQTQNRILLSMRVLQQNRGNFANRPQIKQKSMAFQNQFGSGDNNSRRIDSRQDFNTEQRTEENRSLLTLPIIIGVAVTSFLIGYITA